MQLLQNCICLTIRIGREIQCLQYAGFLPTCLFTRLEESSLANKQVRFSLVYWVVNDK